MLFLAAIAHAKPPKPLSPEALAAIEQNAGLLAAMAGPEVVRVGGEPLASFVPDLAFGFASPDLQSEADRLMHATPVRQCYATALEKRPAWHVVVAMELQLRPDGTVATEVYGTHALPGFEAGWTGDPAFEACLAGAANGLKSTSPPSELARVTFEATFRAATEVVGVPEGASVMGFGPPADETR